MTDRKPRRRISFQDRISELRVRRAKLLASAEQLTAKIERMTAEHKAKAEAMLEEAGE